jgi:hypothetical protein
MRYLAIVLMGVVLACSTASSPNASLPSSQPEAVVSFKPDDVPIVRIQVPSYVQRFQIWAEQEVKKRCAELKLPMVPVIWLRLGHPATTINPDGGRGWINGTYRYADSVITIWIRNGYGNYKSFAEIKHTFYHELLHHYDKINKIDTPYDHNALYAARIIELGWN